MAIQSNAGAAATIKTRLHFTPKLYECSCCHELKPASEFYTQSYTGARTNQCKQCVNIKKSVKRNKLRHSKFISKERIRGMEEPELTLDDWRDAMLWFHGSCAFCGKKEGRARSDKLDRDHLVPLSMGGKTTRRNIIPACPKCNRGRGNKEWREWFRRQAFYTVDRERRIAAWQEGMEVL